MPLIRADNHHFFERLSLISLPPIGGHFGTSFLNSSVAESESGARLRIIKSGNFIPFSTVFPPAIIDEYSRDFLEEVVRKPYEFGSPHIWLISTEKKFDHRALGG